MHLDAGTVESLHRFAVGAVRRRGLDLDHVRALFGDRVTLDVRRATVVMDHVADPLELREYWKRNYGPTIAVYKFNAPIPSGSPSSTATS